MDILIIVLLIVSLVLVIKLFTKVLRVVLIVVIILASMYWAVIKIDEFQSDKLKEPFFAKIGEKQNVYEGIGYEITVEKDANGVITKSIIKGLNKISDIIINK